MKRTNRGFRFDKRISSVVKTSLRLLGKLKLYLPGNDFKRVIHCFVTSHLDCCDSWFVGLKPVIALPSTGSTKGSCLPINWKEKAPY